MEKDINNIDSSVEVERAKTESLVKVAKQFSFKSLKYFVLVAILFAVVNIFIFSRAIISLKVIESMPTYILVLILIFFVGVFLTVLATYLTYRFLLLDGLAIIYTRSTPFFKKLSVIIIDKFEYLVVDKIKLKDSRVNKLFDVGAILTDVYGQKIPFVVQKSLAFLVNKIPLSELLFNIKDTLKDRDSEKASILLYNQMDNYIQGSLLGKGSMKWIFWFLPLNIILQILLIYLFL